MGARKTEGFYNGEKLVPKVAAFSGKSSAIPEFHRLLDVERGGI